MRQSIRILLLTAALGLIASVPAFAQSGAATEEAGTITVGQTVTGTLTTTHPSASYTLTGTAGEAISIHLTSDTFDAYLVLEDANGTSLVENDDSDGTNAAISSFSLPSDGDYTIVAESYGQYDGTGAETGDFTLTVTEQQVNRIEYSQTIQDQLTTDAYSKDYTFSGQEGDTIVATESSTDSNFDSYLYLLDSTGSQLTSNDDSGSSLDAAIGPYVLPSTGTYTLRASTIDENTTGAFTLTLSKIDVASLQYDQATQVSFTPNDTAKYFTFDATAGDIVTITADDNEGGTFDTSLTLNDPTNYQVTTDDNGGPGLDPEIFQQLITTSGTYTVVLQAVAPGSADVTLTVKRGTPPSLEEGTQTLAFTEAQTERALTFTAKAGQEVHLTLHLISGSNGEPSVTVTQDGNTLASASASYVSDLTFSFTPTSDGQVLVQVDEGSYSNVTYQVTLAKSDN
ncbi:MAG TPA: PPC domain-containing protein [Phototrophicaceae bacterium]|nr:PPC domain-containing protein [Phototrophicaceae bacterium]